MKLSALLAITAGALSHAQDCGASAGELDASEFILEDQGENSHLAPLSKIFEKSDQKVNVSDVFADGNHKMSGSSSKLSWESTADYDDFNTDKWVPQGISSSADASAEGTYEGVDGFLVSWHKDDDSSCRISFVDKESNTYRNALLVYPEADDDFRETPVHAGGIVWYGDTLWVVDTNKGIRIFDLSNIWQVDTGDNVGKNSDGTYSAAGYKYVIPQKSWYKFSSSFSFRHSFIALDRTTDTHRILMGEYQTSTDSPTRLVQYAVDEETHKLKGEDGTSKAVWAYCMAIVRMQGALNVGNTFFISRSNGGDNGDLFGWVPGDAAHNNEGFFPPSPEDLSYNKGDDVVHGLTEAAGGRYIITSKKSDITVP